jgi:hypothetical protein
MLYTVQNRDVITYGTGIGTHYNTVPGKLLLHLRIVKLSAQQPLETKERPFDIGHLAGLGSNANLALFLPKGNIAGRGS